jgi:hypothetical protein
VAELQCVLQKDGIFSLEFSVSASDYPKLRWFFLKHDHLYPQALSAHSSRYMVLGVPFVERPPTLKERTDAVCAKMAGGRIRLVEKAA